MHPTSLAYFIDVHQKFFFLPGDWIINSIHKIAMPESMLVGLVEIEKVASKAINYSLI